MPQYISNFQDESRTSSSVNDTEVVEDDKHIVGMGFDFSHGVNLN